jgi:hypothetical protein
MNSVWVCFSPGFLSGKEDFSQGSLLALVQVFARGKKRREAKFRIILAGFEIFFNLRGKFSA